ncbi:hypothetical protein UA32_08160 [Photobacterium angustum]|nr:hypothetical protein UA32_08160 [Photobacterium angustum]
MLNYNHHSAIFKDKISERFTIQKTPKLLAKCSAARFAACAFGGTKLPSGCGMAAKQRQPVNNNKMLLADHGRALYRKAK